MAAARGNVTGMRSIVAWWETLTGTWRYHVHGFDGDVYVSGNTDPETSVNVTGRPEQVLSQVIALASSDLDAEWRLTFAGHGISLWTEAPPPEPTFLDHLAGEG